ncbi:MAG: ribonuclease III domain-containing protein [Fusobacterium gastrosuis]|uniref:Mini-ribonuclease 3 n=1 Tax=Fusobacterium gastrosuis TaxID=1755100 RepID=UPI002A9D569B|nr:ribonuclease III domain-containing protein [Fusobacteriaceae bacterium]MDY5794852.1 ribonuclease III domain-containing protein [Fusobacterium gastrosuis]
MDNVELYLDKKRNIRDYSGLDLAFLGDAVWELEVRKYFLNFGYNIFNLNKLVKSKVNAKAQSTFFKELVKNLDEEYANIAKRAKNSNIKTFPSSCTVMEYKEATAFEAVIGALYLNDKQEEILKILKRFIKGDGNGII